MYLNLLRYISNCQPASHTLQTPVAFGMQMQDADFVATLFLQSVVAQIVVVILFPACLSQFICSCARCCCVFELSGKYCGIFCRLDENPSNQGVECYAHVRVLGLRMTKYLQTANERQNERQRERERQAGRAFCKKDGKLEEAQKQTDFRLIHPPKMNT